MLRLVLELDGEVVERVDPHIGLLHRGTEKLIEHKTYLQAIPYFDRLDYVAPMNQEHAFCLAVEKLLGIEVPRRGQLIRVLYSRDRPHPVAPAQRHDAGDGRRRADAAAVGLRGAREADGVLRARLRLRACTRPISAPAACTRTCRQKLIDDIDAFCDPFLKVVDDIEALLTDNRIFKQRNVDIGVVSLEDAWAWGFSGVMVRGSGAAWDLRKAQPYECYAELDFDIPIGKNGDCYDRYLHPHGGDAPVGPDHEAVRASSCARRKARGRSSVDDSKIVPPKRGEMKRSMEALIHHFKLYTEGFHVPAGEVYAAVEAPKGEFGVYLVSDGTNKPYRCKIRAPGFAHLQAMDFLCRGHMLADVSADPRLARHRVRGGRSVSAIATMPILSPPRLACGGRPRSGREGVNRPLGSPERCHDVACTAPEAGIDRCRTEALACASPQSD